MLPIKSLNTEFSDRYGSKGKQEWTAATYILSPVIKGFSTRSSTMFLKICKYIFRENQDGGM